MRRIVIALAACVLAGGTLTTASAVLPQAAEDLDLPEPAGAPAAEEPESDRVAIQPDPGAPAQEPAPGPGDDRARPGKRDDSSGEHLELRCRPLPEQQAVGCSWTRAWHPDFAAYELWRGTRDNGRERIAVLSGRDQTWYVDEGTQPGEDAVYVVRVRDAEDRTIGRSNPAHTGPHARRHRSHPQAHPEAHPRSHPRGRPGDPAVRPAPRPAPGPGQPVPLPGLLRPTPQPPRERPDEQPAVKLHCEGVAEGVACRWTPSDDERFGAYRLVRVPIDNGRRSGAPETVGQWPDREHTEAVDGSARAGHDYGYAVHVLDGEGRVIGASNPVRVRAGEPAPAGDGAD